MIKSFRHKGLRKLFDAGSTSGVQANHAKRLRMQLAALDTAQSIEDMTSLAIGYIHSRAQCVDAGQFGLAAIGG